MDANTITIRRNVFLGAERYAREHNVSLDAFVEGVIIKAIGLDQSGKAGGKFRLRSFDELSPRVKSLIGSGTTDKAVDGDIDGRKARMEYLQEKYGI